MRRGRSKYHARKTIVDGIRFDSAKEARRYQELKLLEQSGAISGLVLQPAYPLCPRMPDPTKNQSIGAYRADFAYVLADGTSVVEDVKGFKTPLYRWKKRHVEAQYGIRITET